MVTVILTGTLGDLWATQEQLSELTDQEIVDLVKEDPLAFIEDACWEVQRDLPNPPPPAHPSIRHTPEPPIGDSAGAVADTSQVKGGDSA